MRFPRSATLAEHFWARVEKTPTCWLWRGHTIRGYGRLMWDGARMAAHRVSYELHIGAIPDGLVIDHLCRNHGCVNPAHLEVVTIGENMLRGVAPTAVAFRENRCLRGHPYTDDNTYTYPDGKRRCRTCSRISWRVGQLRRTIRALPHGDQRRIEAERLLADLAPEADANGYLRRQPSRSAPPP